ncbi:MAG: hypothetical protein ABF968_04815 [Acetobacter sp.]|uniref:hypothetical protein n=1 Tax=Acetobacter sp. TaxID=440 RepID=UPI0039E901CF
MTALVTGDEAPNVGSAEMGTVMGCLLAVSIRMEKEPEKANISNCERSLRSAANAVMQLWKNVQAEKTRREKALSRVKRKEIAA